MTVDMIVGRYFQYPIRVRPIAIPTYEDRETITILAPPNLEMGGY
jgi:hypothetical protein